MLRVEITEAARATEGFTDYPIFGLPSGDDDRVEVSGPIWYSFVDNTGPWAGAAARAVFEGDFEWRDGSFCLPGLGCAQELDTAWVESARVFVRGKLHVTAEWTELKKGLGISADRQSVIFVGNDFDNVEVRGSNLADRLFGNGGNDEIQAAGGDDFVAGGPGDDILAGWRGADRLRGGGGRDTLLAGAERDLLAGGANADTFVYARTDEAGIGDQCDVLTDFGRGADVVDLGRIDADTGRKGNQTFHYNGATWLHGEAGELAFRGGIVRGDVNGDGEADFMLKLEGVASLSADELIL